MLYLYILIGIYILASLIAITIACIVEKRKKKIQNAEEDGYQRYLSNSGYQPHPLPEGAKIVPPNKGSSVKSSKSSTVIDYNHLINERDWYKQRMEQYRDFIYWVLEYLLSLDSIEAEAYYKNISSEFKRRF